MVCQQQRHIKMSTTTTLATMLTTQHDKPRSTPQSCEDLFRFPSECGAIQEAGMIPSDMSVPAHGLVSMDAPASAVLPGHDSHSQCAAPPNTASCSRAPYDEPGRPLPEPSNPSYYSTTQGTVTQDKTRGQEPGLVRSVVNPKSGVLEVHCATLTPAAVDADVAFDAKSQTELS